MRITYVGFWSELTGYGRACRDNVKALVEAGHEVTIVDWKGLAPGVITTSPETRYEEIDNLVRPWSADSFTGDRGIIYHGQPRLLATMAAQDKIRPRALAMTTWETSQFPQEWADQLTGPFGAVAVPSSWCRSVIEPALSRHLDYPVLVVPHGFDVNFWTERSGIVSAIRDGAFCSKPPRKPGELRFYSLGAWSERKNPLAIVRAFLHAFTADDNVSLTIHSPDANIDQVRSLLARSGLPREAWPRIEIPVRPMSECELYAFHLEHDVFVSASRGEGWGLGLFEACVVGNRVITPFNTGEREFLVEGSHYYQGLIGIREDEVPCFAGEGRAVIRDGAIAGVTASLVHGMTCKQTWREPSVVDLAHSMRAAAAGHLPVYDDPDFYFGRESLERRFGYPSVAAAITRALESCQ